MHKPTVCVDLDGVIADYSKGWRGVENIGNPIPGAKAFLKELATFSDVVIYTVRCCAHVNEGREGHTVESLHKLVEDWLREHEMVYSYIYTGQGKPIASAYIDDRAIPCVPAVHGEKEYLEALKDARLFCRVHDDGAATNGEK